MVFNKNLGEKMMIPMQMQDLVNNCNYNGTLKDKIIQRFLGPNNEIVEKIYSVGPVIGKGGFANVYKITDTQTGFIIAAKTIKKSQITKPRHKTKILNEIKIHNLLKHKNIVNFQ